MCSLYAGGVGRAGSDALCATLYAGDAGGDALRALRMLEAVEGGLCLLDVLEVPEAMRWRLWRAGSSEGQDGFWRRF